MAFIEPMHRNKPNITYLLTYIVNKCNYRNSLSMLYMPKDDISE